MRGRDADAGKRRLARGVEAAYDEPGTDRNRNLGLALHERPDIRPEIPGIADAVVSGEVVWRARRSARSKIFGVGEDDAAGRADAKRDQAAVGQRADAQRDVDRFLEQTEDLVAEDETNVDVRISREELDQDRDQMEAAKTDGRRHCQLAGRRRVLARGSALGLHDFSEDPLAGIDVGAAGLGEHQLAARSIEQLRPKVRFEVRDLAADGRKRRVQAARCGRQAARLCDRQHNQHRLDAIHGDDLSNIWKGRSLFPHMGLGFATPKCPGCPIAPTAGRRSGDLAMRVRNSVAFVTGPNRGIGLVFARELLAAGARKVYAAARRAEGIALDGVERVGLDVTKPDTVAAAARACTDVNLLVNNAGISIWSGFLSPEAVEAARLEMETNYFGPLALSRGFASILAKNGGGAIVNVLSVLSWVAVPPAGTYSASKAAAWALTNWLRTGLREQGTQVLGVHAGPVDTDMAGDLRLPKVNPVDVVQQVLRAIEAGRDEVLADEMTRQVKAGLSDEAGVYLNFDRTARMRQRAEPSATEGRKP